VNVHHSDRVIDLSVHSDLVFRICLGFSGNPLDAEELAQESYLRAIRKINSLNNTHLSREWLLKITQNTCLNYVGKKHLVRWFSSTSENEYVEENTPESLFVKHEQHKIFKQSVQNLPQIYKEIFILREYDELSYREIAKTLGLKKGTVMSRLYRARRTLSHQLRMGMAV
jgi:RNA polymerase sigma-70 factor (ECF subfamily)